ncbi:MAG TPA: hypothetical protein VNZ54_08520, partial [bacterium]|nr:hypothetical protein [bacterium]
MAAYDFENNAHDDSCNGWDGQVHGSPHFVTNTPASISGAYCVGQFSDADYISLPPALLGSMASTGSVEISFFHPYQNYGFGPNSVETLLESTGTFGVFRISVGIGGFPQVDIPSQSSNFEIRSTTAIFTGRPYHFVFSYSGSSYAFYARDLSTQTDTLLFSGTAPSTIDLSGSGSLYVGHEATPGYYCADYVDSLVFHNQALSG